MVTNGRGERRSLRRHSANATAMTPKAACSTQLSVTINKINIALATSLENAAEQPIVQLYAQLVRIEEAFRDAKCPRCGCVPKHSGIRNFSRFDVLLLIAAFAIAVLLSSHLAMISLPSSLRTSSAFHSAKRLR